MTLQLRVFLPTEILVDEAARKVIAQAANGSFALLPRHIDFVTALIPGVLVYIDGEGRERFLGIDEGILIKHGRDVLVSTRKAVRGDDLFALRELVRREIMELDEHERAARSALARLEAGVIRRFIELQERT
jgi:F-type H+-transporting ATPase subunit epsilon